MKNNSCLPHASLLSSSTPQRLLESLIYSSDIYFFIRWNMHNITFVILTILSVKFNGIKYVHNVCNHNHCPFLELFNIILYTNLASMKVTPKTPYLQPLVTSVLLSLRICLFQVPHVSGIVQYLYFFVWPISRSIMFQGLSML